MSNNKYLGIDIGAETVKLTILEASSDGMKWTGSTVLPHGGDPREIILRELGDGTGFAGAAVTGRGAGVMTLAVVPAPRALERGVQYVHPQLRRATVLDAGAHGFSVLEIHDANSRIFRENTRCSQGTGNFLAQLTGRFGLEVEAADRLAAAVETALPLSGRCPVILKTDMTHLANKGEDRARILAGLFDAVAENIEVLVKPGLAPATVVLSGQVCESERIRRHFESFFSTHGMRVEALNETAHRFYGALGAALEAADRGSEDGFAAPALLDDWFSGENHRAFEVVPPLVESLARVQMTPAEPLPGLPESGAVVLGLDMGSTGSKIAAIDAGDGRQLWNAYVRTGGDPVGAAQRLLGRFFEAAGPGVRVPCVGVTGSGREIVGALIRSAAGDDGVTIINEIAAHAEGALAVDPEVDTIFEIGGQDAKYIRLMGREIVDAAMNEACSAGTGSFIEEQGLRLFPDMDIAELSELALAARSGVSLGQHCSVFMAEVIEQAKAAGEPLEALVAGIYDSVIQNYMNRVKGPRDIGKKIFCQGMPFSSMALAAAVSRQTGREVVVPPAPGLMGALGIALLARRHGNAGVLTDLPLRSCLDATVEGREEFVCTSTKGCSAPGNRCRIDRMRVRFHDGVRPFFWGGACSLYDRSPSRRSLPASAPDPFVQRAAELEALVRRLDGAATTGITRPTLAITHEFLLQGLFPFFATYFHELGFKLQVPGDADAGQLRRGIAQSNVPMCAPMQMYTGQIGTMIDGAPDFVFLPMLRDVPRVGQEEHSTVCPVAQASADLLKRLYCDRPKVRFLQPVIDMGPGNLDSDLFRRSCEEAAQEAGITDPRLVERAFSAARATQLEFDAALPQLGRDAIEWAREHDRPVVVVLGRTYTIFNHVLNSNVPRLLRDLGAVAVPVDCYPVAEDVPVFETVYWGYGQTNLRAAHEVRRNTGHYAVFCSNYSCGPDSFSLHFTSTILQGKPHAIIETDGHAGDAGTRTRLEAFLYCVSQDRQMGHPSQERPREQLRLLELDSLTLADTRRRGDILLFPRMGENAELAAASLRGDGFQAEALPMPTRHDLRLGRKYTSGKECLPAVVTLGSLLARLQEARHEDRFAFFMPTASGPCRFGMYNLLHKTVLKRLGLLDRVKLVSQPDSDYFAGVSKGLALKTFAAFVAGDMLTEALLYTRPVEVRPGAAQEIFDRTQLEMIRHLEGTPAPSLGNSLMETMGGLFGVRGICQKAAAEFARIMTPDKQVPTVAVVGEIYVRLDPFSNDFVIDKLEKRGLRARLAPLGEWLEYTDLSNEAEIRKGRFSTPDAFWARAVSTFLQKSITARLYRVFAEPLGWPQRTTAVESLQASAPYLRADLLGEAVLTLGGPVHEYRHGVIDGVVSVGPLECMPNKISEAQFFHAQRDLGLPFVVLQLNGEPLDEKTLDHFVYEVRRRSDTVSAGTSLSEPSWAGPF
ncbi:CoA activase [Myxococcota bacterium]|nr:CoA activase [Myxococcota bacterium]